MDIGIWELLIVLVIVILIFGPKALPKLGKSAGKTLHYLKKGLENDYEITDDDNDEIGNKDDKESVGDSDD